MTLSPWDIADLDRLAAIHASTGKRPAWRAYTTHAIRAGWGNTPAWVAGRGAFEAFWRGHRAAFRAARVSPYRPAPAIGLYGLLWGKTRRHFAAPSRHGAERARGLGAQATHGGV